MNYFGKAQIQFKGFLSRQEAINFYSFVTSLVLVILSLGIYALNYISLPSQIPLFYSLPWGEDQLVSLPQFIILPGIMILVILINLFISWHLHESQKGLKRVISIATAINCLLLFLAAFRIIYTFV